MCASAAVVLSPGVTGRARDGWRGSTYRGGPGRSLLSRGTGSVAASGSLPAAGQRPARLGSAQRYVVSHSAAVDVRLTLPLRAARGIEASTSQLDVTAHTAR